MIAPSNEQRKKKTVKWDHKTIKILIDVVLEQANQGEHNRNNLTKLGWRASKAKFKTMSGLNYDDDLQIKNKWDALKSKQLVRYQVVGKETGFGWNAAKDNLAASVE